MGSLMISAHCCRLLQSLLLILLLIVDTHLHATEHNGPVSGYLHDIHCPFNSPEYSFHEYKNSALRSLTANTEFHAATISHKGLCLGLACAYLQAAVTQPDTRPLLSQRLQRCSQPQEQGWKSMGSHWATLEQAIKEAGQHYQQFRLAYGLPDTPSTLEQFSQQDREAAELLSTQVWIKWLYREQARQQGCSADITEAPAHSRLSMTRAWPGATTRAGMVQFLEDLLTLPGPAHYLFTTGHHALALSVEEYRLLLFDQNNPCYFLQVARTSSGVMAMAESLFAALLPSLSCEQVALHSDYVEIQCGDFKARLPSDPHQPWDINNHAFLKAFQTHAVFAVQVVFPEQSSQSRIDRADEAMEWLTDKLADEFTDKVNPADAQGMTPLHLASRAGNLQSVTTLLKAGASPNTKAEGGITPLQLARAYPAIVKVLEESGAYESGNYLADTEAVNLYQRYSPPQHRAVPEDLQQYHAEELQRSQYRSDHEQQPSTHPSFSQHCPAGSCGANNPVIGDSPAGYRFRKALAAIGRGEDPITQGIERTTEGMVKLAYDHFPSQTQTVLTHLAQAGETVDAVVNFADRATGQIVSRHWNQLDQTMRDELAGLGKVVSVVVPVGKVNIIGKPSKNTVSGNPFKDKSANEIDEMFKKKGFRESGPAPLEGVGGYVNPHTGRSYHIDPVDYGKYREENHVDVNRPRDYKGTLDKKKFPYKE